MNKQTRVVLIDDDPNIHDAVEVLLKTVHDLQLVGRAFNGEIGIQLCRVAKPDIILIDVVMPGLSGQEVTSAIMKILPTVKIVALSSYHEYEQIRAMLNSGAIGYLVKHGLVQDLIPTIRSAMKGNTILSPQVAQTLFAPTTNSSDFGLSDRELEVIKLMAQGMTYDNIALTLQISKPTVRFHVNNILEKMQVETRSEALVLAAKNELV